MPQMKQFKITSEDLVITLTFSNNPLTFCHKSCLKKQAFAFCLLGHDWIKTLLNIFSWKLNCFLSFCVTVSLSNAVILKSYWFKNPLGALEPNLSVNLWWYFSMNLWHLWLKALQRHCGISIVFCEKMFSEIICSMNFQEIVNFFELLIISSLNWVNLKTQAKVK